MNSILCGLPMSGKTTIGQKLAAKLNWAFIDTDRLVEAAYTAKTGQVIPCRQIFLQEGEECFRQLEKQQIASLIMHTQSVIATGGGSLNDPDNIQALQQAGCLIYLQAPVTVLWKRILQCGIPAYLDPANPEQAFYQLAEKRTPLYERAAYISIETSQLSEEEVVNAILTYRKRDDGK